MPRCQARQRHSESRMLYQACGKQEDKKPGRGGKSHPKLNLDCTILLSVRLFLIDQELSLRNTVWVWHRRCHRGPQCSRWRSRKDRPQHAQRQSWTRPIAPTSRPLGKSSDGICQSDLSSAAPSHPDDIKSLRCVHRRPDLL